MDEQDNEWIKSGRWNVNDACTHRDREINRQKDMHKKVKKVRASHCRRAVEVTVPLYLGYN